MSKCLDGIPHYNKNIRAPQMQFIINKSLADLDNEEKKKKTPKKRPSR